MATTKNHSIWIAQRTPIQIIASAKTVTCWRCKREVQPAIINTAYLSQPLSKCPKCHSLLQGQTNEQ